MGAKITGIAVAFLFHLISSRIIFQVIDLTGNGRKNQKKQC
ncbi:hypothetical protein SEEA0322_12631 [Salmonella enterica subsp. enterica serovar Agona str. 0322]|nr:hypothetical protein SEEA0322_12631 [Salmonella enterica subsp. enterica serovar Agona str. 0322]